MANTQTTVPIFVAAQVLEAAQLNNSAATGVPVFATTVTRDAGFGGAGEKALAEGQLCYLESTNVVQYYDGAAWATVGPASSGAVVQVKSSLLTATFSGSAPQATGLDVTTLAVSITPTSASNKVLILCSLNLGKGSDGQGVTAILTGGNCATYRGDAALTRGRYASGQGQSANGRVQPSVAMMYLDSPATTSATSYSVNINHTASGGTVTMYVNRTNIYDDVDYVGTYASTITAIEVTP